MTANHMVALAALDEAHSIEQSDFESIGDQLTEADAETEVAAFMARPESKQEIETKPVRNIDAASGGTSRSAFAEAAGAF